MLSRKKKIVELLKDGNFTEAKKTLKWASSDSDTLYWSSLLYRLDDQYDLEAKVVKKYLKKSPQNNYMQERSAWLKKPLSEKLVPRKAVEFERMPGDQPKAEMLENICFISGADSGYFNHLVQLLESLQRTSLYKDVPIGILSCGLTDSEQDFLLKTFNVKKIVKPDWKVAPDENIKMFRATLCEGHKAIMCKPFLPEYFPEWKYLMWFDADSWVQDERTIDKFINKLEQNGIGISCFEADGYIHVATGVFAISSDSKVNAPWQEKYLESLKTDGFRYAFEEITLRAVLLECKITDFLPAEEMCRICLEGIPYVKKGSSTLYLPKTNRPLGIYAFDGYTDKFAVFWPTEEREDSFENAREIKSHRRKTYHLLKGNQKKVHKAKKFKNQKLISLHYRTWPWADKPQIIEDLRKSVADYLARDSSTC
jgi:hypothetical protein